MTAVVSRQMRSRATLAALATVLCSVPLAFAGLALAPGDKVPELRGTTVAGERVVVDFSEPRFTLVNFWATWCEPCRTEMPALEKLHADHNPDLRIVGVIRDSATAEEVASFLEAMKVSYTNMWAQDRYAKNWSGASSLPTSFLIDAEGRVVRRYVGATEEQTAGLVHDVEAVLDGRPLGPFIEPAPGSSVTGEDKPKPETGSRFRTVKEGER